MWTDDAPRKKGHRGVKVAGVIVAVLLVLAGIGALSGGGDKGSTTAAKAASDTAPQATATTAGPTTPPAAVLPAMGTAARAKGELRDKFGSRVMGIDESGGQFTVGLKYVGKATSQVDAMDAFRQVYKDAGYAPKEMLVMFHGPLVIKATGAEHDGVYTVYDITRKQAARIVWANQDQVDWTHYRTMQRADL